MTVRSFTDEELLRVAETALSPRAQLRTYAREIVRLREALREIEAVEARRAVAAQAGSNRSSLEISASALRGERA